jgi:hypothetical protein
MKTAMAVARAAKTAARPALWLCACNLLTAALSAQCTSVSQVPNGTISSGTPCYSNNDTLTAAGVTINGSASVTFVAGKTIHLTPGFRATAPTGGAPSTTFHAWVETAPSVTSVSPASGSVMTQTFTFTASSPSGFADITELQLLFNTTVSGADGCYIRYRANALYLADNSGTNWLGGFAPGSAGTANNSYCSISGSGASVSGSGTQLSVTVPVTFQSVFAGAKNTYAITFDDDAMNSGWQPMGTWTVPGTPVGPDFELTTSQNTWYVTTGPSTPTFNIDIKPLNGLTGPVSLTVEPFFYCYGPAFNPASVSAPSWRTTLSMTCNEPNVNHTYWATVTATGGGKTHQLGLYLYIIATQQYLLTTSVNPPGAGSVTLNPPGGWYTSGTQVQVTATPTTGYQFTGFSGSLAGGSPGYLIMNSSKSAMANFTQQQPSTVTQTITTSPVTGLLLTVDGTSCTSPCTFQWTAGTNHTITTAATQAGGIGRQYTFANWSDGGALSHQITASSVLATWTANFGTQYYLTTAAGTGGSISPASGWYSSGGQVQVAATPGNGFAFGGFSGALTGATTPQSLTLNGPKSVAANFTSGAGFTLNPMPEQTVTPGATGATTATTTVSPFGGFNQNVTFAYANAPVGVTATFYPATVGPSGSTRVTFSAAEGIAAGTYTLNLQAAGGGVQQIQAVSLKVLSAGAPTGPRSAVPGAFYVPNSGVETGEFEYVLDAGDATFFTSCSVAGDNVTARITSSSPPSQWALSSFFVRYTASTNAAAGERTVSCHWSHPTYGEVDRTTDPIVVYDAGPQVSSVQPSILEQSTSQQKVTFNGSGFGSRPPTLEFSPPGVQWSIAPGNTPERFDAYLVAPNPGPYTVTVISNGTSASGFQSGAGRSNPRSNQANLTVTAAPVVLHVTWNGQEIFSGQTVYVPLNGQPFGLGAYLTGSGLTGTVVWGVQAQYKDAGDSDEPFNESYPLPNGSSSPVPVQTAWSVSLSTGGRLTVRWSLNGGATVSDFWFNVRGTNPFLNDVLDYLGNSPWFFWRLASHESEHVEAGQTVRFRQFKADGTPTFGAPHGYGMMKLDPAPYLSTLFDWRANIDQGRVVLQTKEAEFASRWETYTNLRRVWLQAHPESSIDEPARTEGDCTFTFDGGAPPGNATYYDANWIKRYNGASCAGGPGICDYAELQSQGDTQPPVWVFKELNRLNFNYVARICSQPASR